MRIVVVKNPAELSSLMGISSAAQLKDLQRFNPHLDLNNLKPGSVIVVPESAGGMAFPAGDSKSIGFEAMDSFIDFAKDALGTSSQRAAQSAARAKAEEAALAAAMKSKSIKVAIDQSAELKALASDAVAQAKADSAAAAASAKAFDALSKDALSQLSALAKRLA